MKTINITSGDYLNNFLMNTYTGIYIPFNEAILDGTLLYPLFDEEFIAKRSFHHNVDKDD